MNDWKLPEELQRLEDELMALPRPTLPASLRPGLDSDMRSRLRGERRRRRYGYVAAVAAAAALWANFSLSAATATNFHLAGRPQRQDTTALESQLHDLIPELGPRELRRQALMLQASSHVAPRPLGPALAAPPSRLLSNNIDQLL